MSTVVKIKDLRQSKLAIDLISDFAAESGINSPRTKKAYFDDVHQFIKIVLGENEFIEIDDLVKAIDRKNIINYRTVLLDEKNLTASTVKRKLSSLQELIKYMYSLGLDVNLNLMQSLTKIKSVNNSYEVLSIEEANMIITWIRDNEKRNSIEKYYYCLLAFDTGIRAEAINKLTPSSFIVKDDEVTIRGVDKGKKAFVKSISKEFYDNMYLELDMQNRNVNESIFNFSEKNRFDMIKRAKQALGMDNRNITFHSFKKGAVTYAYETTKDIQIARQVGSHSSLNTTQTYLADSQESFKGAVSNNYSIKNKNINFNDYSKEELIEVLNELSEGAQLQIKTILSDKIGYMK